MSNVLVACKLPNGLRMRIYKEVERSEPTPMGHKMVKVWEPTGDVVVLAGTAVPFGTMPEDPIVNGYSLTPVDKEFWDTYVSQNKDSEAIKNELIFAHEKQDNVVAQTKSQRKQGVVSGMEPLDPNNLPKGIDARGMKIATADEMPPIPVTRGEGRPSLRRERA